MLHFTFSKQSIFLVIISIIFLALGILRVHDLSIYTPDSARYLIVGNALAHGKGFVDDTTPDPDRFLIQAPLYPVLLVPVQAIFPLSIIAAKVWTLLWGLLAVILFYFWISRFVINTLAMFSILLFALNPLMLVYSTEVLSEAPFITFVLLTLILFERIIHQKVIDKKLFIIFGIILCAVVLLREAGITLFITIVLFLISKKDFKNIVLLVILVGGLTLLWHLRNFYWIKPSSPMQMSNYSLMLQNYVTNPGTPLINEFGLRIWINLKSSIMQVGGMIIYPLFIAQQFKLELMPSGFHEILVLFFTTIGKYLVLIITLPLLVYGISIDFKKSPAAILRLIFIIIYYGLLLIYPVLDIRFLLLFLPFLLFYIFLSLDSLLKKFWLEKSFKFRSVVYFSAFIMLVPNISGIVEILKLNLSYSKSPIDFYQKYGQKTKCPIMFTQPWSLLGKWIENNLPENVVIASPTKNIATFVGSRKVLEIDQGVVQPVFEMLLRDNKVDYILSPSGGQDLKIYHFLMTESRRFWFEEVYRVGNLYLYKIHSRFKEPNHETVSFYPDTTSVSYILGKSRLEMSKGNYHDAHELLKYVLSLDSTHPGILYHMILYYTLTNDSLKTRYYYNKLYSLPQALGFVMQARLLIQAQQKLNNAYSQRNAEWKAVELYEAASVYWKMGYYNLSAQIMNNLFNVDSNYFVGMLWGLHYNMFIGDTIMPVKYLNALKKIDSTNAVVQAFDKIFNLKNNLLHTSEPMERSKIHTEIGSLYKQIELNEESLDEAELAIGEDPENVNAWILMAQIFERKTNLKMAIYTYNKIKDVEPNNRMADSKIDSLKLILSKR